MSLSAHATGWLYAITPEQWDAAAQVAGTRDAEAVYLFTLSHPDLIRQAFDRLEQAKTNP